MDEDGVICAKKLGETILTGTFQNMDITIRVNVYRAELPLKQNIVEEVANYSVFVQDFKDEKVEEVLFKGKDVLKEINDRKSIALKHR